jgi:AbrB family looped-hinge helix DNA binding protein
MRITSRGKVTIPFAIREKAGLLPNTEVELEFDGEAVLIRRARRRTVSGRGARLVTHMRGPGDGTMTTDEIMALIRGE